MNAAQKKARAARRSEINSKIIRTIAAVGIIGVGLVAPQVVAAGATLYRQHMRQKRYAAKLAFNRLVEKGYIQVVEGFAKLTPKGEMFAAQLGEGRLVLDQGNRWDKKWRIIIFDIPEIQCGVRNRLRELLSGLGFYKLQNSVWVTPYECESVVILLKIDLGLGRAVRHITASKIEMEHELRQYFSLPE